MKKINIIALFSTLILVGAGCGGPSQADISAVEGAKARALAEVAAQQAAAPAPVPAGPFWRHPTYGFGFSISPALTAVVESKNSITFKKTATGEPVGTINISDVSKYGLTNNKDGLPDKINGQTINDITINGEDGIIVRDVGGAGTSEVLQAITPDHKLRVTITANVSAQDMFALTSIMSSWRWQ